jgi:ATP-dependent Clp protease adaptor protein ClpS
MSHVHRMPVYQPSGNARRDADPPPPRRDDDRGTGTEREEGVALAERPKTRKPSLYRVLLHNDDYTTMEFVVEMLTRHFGLSATDATRVMLQVHHLGVGVAGTFTRDEAETRIERVTADAEAAGFPLLLTMEPE